MSTATGPTQPPIQLVPGVKWPGRDVDHPPHLAPRLKKEQSYTPTPPLSLRGLFQSELYLLRLPLPRCLENDACCVISFRFAPTSSDLLGRSLLLISAQTPAVFSYICRHFPQYLQTSGRQVFPFRPLSLPCTPFPIHCSLSSYRSTLYNLRR